MTVKRIELKTGKLEVSRIIPGVMRVLDWQLTSAQLLDWIKTCLELGLTTFDHADIYGNYRSQAAFGAALALDRSVRERMELVSKVNIKLVSDARPEHRIHSYDSSFEHIMQSVNTTLKELRTDYLDLLLIHRVDALMDADEVASAFTHLQNTGKVRHFGVSNFYPQHFELLQSRLDFPLVTNQVELSVMAMDSLHNGMLDLAQKLRHVPMIWGPLAAGHIFRAENERAQRVRAMLEKVGEELGGAPIDQVALAWVMRHPSKPAPVLGTGKIERLKSAIQACDLKMSREQWYMIWEASAGHEVP